MLRAAILLVLVVPLAGCQLAAPMAVLPLATSRTVLQGTKQMVEIRSEPPGATVSIQGYETRTTPTFIMLARGHSHTVRISKDGFKTITADLVSQRSDERGSNVLADVLDGASGAAWELNPARLTVTLESEKAVAVAPKPAPIVEPQPTPALPAQAQQPPQSEASVAVIEQIARIDRLLAQGVITQQEHDVLMAAAMSAAALAGVQTGQ